MMSFGSQEKLSLVSYTAYNSRFCILHKPVLEKATLQLILTLDLFERFG
jgi:hypothetical protein